MKYCVRILAVLFSLLFSNATKAQDNALPVAYYSYADVERKAFLVSYISWPHPLKQKCVDSLPYIRYAKSIPVPPCGDITPKATGCYDTETEHPRITIWVVAITDCALHVELLLHEFLHHWLYCHFDIMDHPDKYFEDLLKYQVENAINDICVSRKEEP